MKKIVWIFNHYAGKNPYERGGRHYNFAKYLRRAGYEPVIFCANSKHNAKGVWFDMTHSWEVHHCEEIDTPFVYIRARAYVGNGKQRIFNMADYYKNLMAAAPEYAEKFGKPQVIYASSVHPLALLAGIRLAKKFGCEAVCEVRDLWPESLIAYGLLPRNNPVTAALYMGEKWLYRHAHRLIMTWPGGYDYIRERGWDKCIPAEKVTHIPNGVDLAAFDKNTENRVEDAELEDQTHFKAIYCGSIRQVNNLKLLVEAAKILHNRGNDRVKILVYGDGDQRQSLAEEAKELPNISFRGRVEKYSVPYVLSRGNVSILHNSRSVLDKYGQSQNKFFEYLAAGKPVLMTYSVGHSICKARQCGLELEDQTPEAVADALEALATLPEQEYRACCENARAAAHDFDFATLTQTLIRVLEG